MKKIFAFILALAFVVIINSSCTASCQREMKSMQSNWGGGLQRTVTLMDYQGDTLKQWSGKFDVRDMGADNQIYFDLDGKRIWIQGGIVVNEEW